MRDSIDVRLQSIEWNFYVFTLLRQANWGRAAPDWQASQPDAFAFNHFDNLIRRRAETIDDSAWPMDFDVRVSRLSHSEMNAQIVLGDVAAAAAYLVHLPVTGCRAINPGSNTRTIRFHPDGLHF